MNKKSSHYHHIYLIILMFMLAPLSALSSDCLDEIKKKYPKLITVKPSYAKNFELYRHLEESNNFTFLKIKKLWIGDNNGKEYFISNKPQALKDCNKIKLIDNKKNNRVIPLSTSYVAFLEALELENSIISFPNTNFLNSKRTLDLVNAGKIKNLKYPLNIEEIISHKPDLIISYSSSSPEVLGLEKIEKLTSKVIFFPEYLEIHPLARIEWIIVLGSLMNRVPAATLYFNKIVRNYSYYKSKIIGVKNRVKIQVLLGSKINGQWTTPSNHSYLGILVQDAGGRILINEKKLTHDNLKFENILQIKNEIDVWLPHTIWQNKKDMINEDTKYNLLLNNSNISIYNASKKISATSGFDFWETGLSRPDLILKDLNTIFKKVSSKSSKNIQKELIWYQKL